MSDPTLNNACAKEEALKKELHEQIINYGIVRATQANDLEALYREARLIRQKIEFLIDAAHDVGELLVSGDNT